MGVDVIGVAVETTLVVGQHYFRVLLFDHGQNLRRNRGHGRRHKRVGLFVLRPTGHSGIVVAQLNVASYADQLSGHCEFTRTSRHGPDRIMVWVVAPVVVLIDT
ncbi:unannotated protein [freshwater metagenome]|uniref:Unannotated protein n=1 Tax=freshwater metagenome TaxID=449393 RepID=A0A6J6X3X3_9ZZZZ